MASEAAFRYGRVEVRAGEFRSNAARRQFSIAHQGLLGVKRWQHRHVVLFISRISYRHHRALMVGCISARMGGEISLKLTTQNSMR